MLQTLCVPTRHEIAEISVPFGPRCRRYGRLPAPHDPLRPAEDFCGSRVICGGSQWHAA